MAVSTSSPFLHKKTYQAMPVYAFSEFLHIETRHCYFADKILIFYNTIRLRNLDEAEVTEKRDAQVNEIGLCCSFMIEHTGEHWAGPPEGD